MTTSKSTKSTSKRVTPKGGGDRKQVTSAVSWKNSSTLELKVPSGKVAKVRNPGMKAFVTAGLIPNSLMPIVTEALERGAPPSPSALKKAAADNSKFIPEILEATDAVTIHCVIEPQVHKVPIWTIAEVEKGLCTSEQVGQEAPQLKDDELLYVDEVDFEDKMFIFQWACGGTRDVERFRKQYSAGVEVNQRRSDVERKA